jgi:AcrR family transcriptional regulator
VARREPAARRTKEEVAEAALKLFCERGYHAVTIDEIAQRAGVTKGAFYYYFADKEDLAKDLWHELWGRLAAQSERALDPAADVGTNLKRCFAAVLDEISNLGEARFFLREAWVLPAVEVAGRSDQQAAVALVGALLEEARAEGQLAPVEVGAAAGVLLGAYAEAMLHILTTGETGPTLEVVGRIIDALVPAPGASPSRSAHGTPRRAPARAGRSK